ncbi:unnamed protein product [Pieris brassicae]|uniref:Uncharacterized protein n=1 Tax=Pieris brassicae TaxID=7116 RepID=A0A9P0X4H6_PIEBR|nr:unnamed protein product [Pieris brassicae]
MAETNITMALSPRQTLSGQRCEESPVYALTSVKSEELNEIFFNLDTALKLTKPNELSIVTGEVNSKIGQGAVSDITVRFGLGTRHDRGETGTVLLTIRFCCCEYFLQIST